MSDMNNPADDNNGAMDDLWAEALSEQKSTSSKSAADAVFQQFGGGDVSGTLQDIDLIMDIPVKLTVELGRTRMTIKELLRLTQGSVVALDGLAGEPLDILINGYLIAQGEVVVVAESQQADVWSMRFHFFHQWGGRGDARNEKHLFVAGTNSPFPYLRE